ncbi:polysaccharide pyruvyl transferase family protein [Kocuria sp.]|uniref:polysaccharide pyruvyl transferase family protein n=1 Tax=Kocuria sp. TaxID=1871328 RepID=UPI0026DFD5E3|nr:polysaccharide pyruvyl transferase family protein [Kocuria sp.]MDO5619198.1 polysaccharide pyruvyl transferase family protein [Kocuria sp.]
MRVAILNDIGQPTYHVGDEAMCHAAVDALRARGVSDVVLLTRDVQDTLSRYEGVEAIPVLDFPWVPEQREKRLAELDRVLTGEADVVPESDPIFELLENLRGVDAVLVAGGGNMNSDFGWLLYERAAVTRVAAHLNKPVVFSGQTLGPVLSVPDREVLRQTVEMATLVGLRDPESYQLAQDLCPNHRGLRQCADDAVGWALSALSGPWAKHGVDAPATAPLPSTAEPGVEQSATSVVEAEEADPTRPRIVATFAPGTGAFEQSEAAEAFAVVLDALIHRTGGVVEFVPHMARVGELDGDVAFHRLVATRMHGEFVHRSIESAQESLRRTLTADYVVSSRYHPVVFGLAGGATVLPIAVDNFAEVRMDGACSTWGISGQVVPLAALLTPRDVAWDMREAAQKWTREMVEGHAQFGDDLLARRAAVRENAAGWWDTVTVGLTGSVPAPSEVAQVPPAGAGSEIARALRRDWSRPVVPVPAAQHATVAIVMRTKNRAVLLERALDDVLAQSFADWRLMVVNDGGDPEPVDALVAAREREFAGRVSVIHNRRSFGMEAASNIGVRATDSDFLCIHDDDDRWHPLFLQRTVAFLERPSCTDGGVMVRTEIVYEHVDMEAQPPTVEETGREVFWAGLQLITLTDLVAINRGVPISFLYRRSMHAVIGDYDETLPAVGDWEFHLRFAQAATIGFLNTTTLAFWQQRPEQTGELGNSMFSGAAQHKKHDLVVRERHFQEWTRENGIGLPLYMAREFLAVQERMEHLERQNAELAVLLREQQRELHHVANVLADNSFFGFIKRKLRRFFGIS